MKTRIFLLSALCATLFFCAPKAYGCYNYLFTEEYFPSGASGTISCNKYYCVSNSTNVWFVSTGTNQRVRLKYTLNMPVIPGNRLRIWQSTDTYGCYQCMSATTPPCLILDLNHTNFGGYAAGEIVTDYGVCFIVKYDVLDAGIGGSSGFQIDYSSGEIIESDLHVQGLVTATDLNVTGSTKLDGNVGIGLGTIKPMEKLHVGGNIIADTVNVNNVRAWDIIGFNSITTYGDVGIGLLGPPTERLEVDGTIKTTNLNATGKVGIGVADPLYPLDVDGIIRADGVIVKLAPFPDYVFTPNYKLPPLNEVETHIQEQGHLPDMPPATEVEENGIDLAEMNAKLLQKVEELFLYTIELNKKIVAQDEIIKQLLEK